MELKVIFYLKSFKDDFSHPQQPLSPHNERLGRIYLLLVVAAANKLKRLQIL